MQTEWLSVRQCSHTLRSDFHYETYIGISPYRTPAMIELQYMQLYHYVT